MENLGFYNDRFIDIDKPVISMEERGLQFGDGIYEVIAVYNGHPYTLNEHLQRLENSSRSILMELPKSIEELTKIINEGIKRLDLIEGTVYIQVTRGSAPRNHLFPHNTAPNIYIVWKKGLKSLQREQREGVTVYTYPDERWENCYIKSICLLPNVIAKEKAYQMGGYEALLIRDGHVKEGSSSNIFIVKDGVFKTPRADQSILNGITRQIVILLLQQNGLSIIETDLEYKDLEKADEIMVTSTTSGIIPVIKMDETLIGAEAPGPFYQRLIQWYFEDVRRECMDKNVIKK